MHLLLAEDEAALANWLVRALGQSNYRVDWVVDGRMVLRALRSTSYDALILDLGLPGRHGYDVLNDLRAADARLPILVLTAQTSLTHRVTSLNAGADDFVAKPFDVEELEARLLALVRRSRGHESPRFSCGALVYDAATKRFQLDGAALALTAREHAVLRALIERHGEPLSKQEIFEQVFPNGSDASVDAIEVLVHRLRKRLAAGSPRITTLRGLGYMLEAGQ